jgi:hypothetical protein
MVAAGDGVVSDEEWNYWAARAKAMGIDQSVIDGWKESYPTADLEADVKKLWELGGALSYAFLYDGIKVARADGYVEGEKEAVRRAAKICGIPESVVTQIEHLCALEEQVRALRVTLLYPEPNRFMDPAKFHGK